jgi:hypothetical protein
MAINTSITTLPTPPTSTDSATFSTRADAFLAALPTFQTQLNSYAGEANSTQTAINATQTAAATSATQAASSATQSASSAAAAAASVTQAASSATQAASSASDSSNSAIVSLSYLQQFRAVYAGAQVSDPTVDGNGAPINAGDFYVNTTTNTIRAYTGTQWVQGISVVAGVNSVNTAQGDVILKTVNGQSLSGAGDVDTNTTALTYALVFGG